MADNSKITAANIDSIQICKKYKKDKKLAASVIWERFRFFFEQPKKSREYSKAGNHYTILHYLLSEYDFGFTDIEEFNAEVKNQYEDMCLDFDTYIIKIKDKISLILFPTNRNRNYQKFLEKEANDQEYLFKMKLKGEKKAYFKKRIYMSFSMPINETKVYIISSDGRRALYPCSKNNQAGKVTSSGEKEKKGRVYTQKDFHKICNELFYYMSEDEGYNKHTELKTFIQDNYYFNNRIKNNTKNNGQLYIPENSRLKEAMVYYYQMRYDYDENETKNNKRSKIKPISDNPELLQKKSKKSDPENGGNQDISPQKNYNGLLHEFIPALTAFLIMVVENSVLSRYDKYYMPAKAMSDKDNDNDYINTSFLKNLKRENT